MECYHLSEKARPPPLPPIPPTSNFFKNVRNYFREYCTCTTIHGFKYFGEKRTIFERAWWSVVFVACLSVCGYSVYTVYQKWDQAPVIVTFATKGTPIYKIPFPAVTICPDMNFEQTSLNYTDLVERSRTSNITEKELEQLNHASLVCKPLFEDYFDESLHNKTVDDSFFDTISLNRFRISLSGKFLNKDITLNNFTEMVTDEGVCYTFNMMDRDDIYRKNVVHYDNFHKVEHRATNWSMEDGYASNTDGSHSYPWRALLSGASNGLSLYIVSFGNDFDYSCSPIQGFKVLLHTPTRIPRPSQEFFRLPLNQDVVAAIQPVIITTSDAVKRYNAKRRECYFPTERTLKYFRIYTSLNCKLECLTKFTLEMCGCVQFYMPRENGTRICGFGSVECAVDAANEMNLYLYNMLDDKTRNSSSACHCLPICSDISYEVETSQTSWDWAKIFKAAGEEINFDSTPVHASSLTVYFKTSNFITSERNELYGPTDFLANFGGVLGLFTGFSILSLMEILYFLTVRLWCNIRLFGHWAGPPTQ